MIQPSNAEVLEFLCLSTTGWDEVWGSRQHIMQRLVKAGHKVLFVERQIGPEHILSHPEYRTRGMTFQAIKPPIQVQENLWRWQPPLMIPGRYYSHILNRIGQNRLAGQIKAILMQLNFDSPVLWLYPPQSAPMIGAFQERLAVYHCIERFAGEQLGLKRRVMIEQENQLLAAVDLVFVHSQGLKKLYELSTRHPILVIPSAADVTHFQSDTRIHPAMEDIPRPRLVAMGVLDSRIDFELLRNIMVMQPDWHLVLIGKLKKRSPQSDALMHLPNVHVLGHQPYDALPSLVNGADVTLIPYRLTEMTRYINPLKAYEYLAAGKPTVSVELPELIPLSGWLTLIQPHGHISQEYARHFIAGIKAALDTDTVQRTAERREFAHSHSWDLRVEHIMEAIWRQIPA